MKRLIVVLMVLSTASMANAALQITVSDAATSATTITSTGTLSLGIEVGSTIISGGPWPSDGDNFYWALVGQTSLGTINYTSGIVSPGVASETGLMVSEGFPASQMDLPLVPGLDGTVGGITLFVLPSIAAGTQIFDDIVYTATAAGTQTLRLYETDGVNMYLDSTVTVNQTGPAPSPTITVPNIVGMTAAAANMAIVDANLVVGTVTTAYSNTVAAGNVISQNPAASTVVATGSAVSYVESLGRPIVPNVVGMTAADANAAITSVGLKPVNGGNEYSKTVAAGLVSSQIPAGSTAVNIGSTVIYKVSSLGKPTVPNVVGMTASDANTAIVDANLVVGTVTTKYSNTVDAGKVIRQSPAAGKAVAIGSKVKYVISLGKKPIVPNVVGMTASDANTAIVDANLVVGAVTTKYSNTVDAGKVTRQSPAAGRAVAIGSKVKYVSSLGKK
ncbi:MAG: PASTA domain-containing protein [Sedimentisphaerales bacterium]